jgi:hypothetical protein
MVNVTLINNAETLGETKLPTSQRRLDDIFEGKDSRKSDRNH